MARAGSSSAAAARRSHSGSCRPDCPACCCAACSLRRRSAAASHSLWADSAQPRNALRAAPLAPTATPRRSRALHRPASACRASHARQPRARCRRTLCTSWWSSARRDLSRCRAASCHRILQAAHPPNIRHLTGRGRLACRISAMCSHAITAPRRRIEAAATVRHLLMACIKCRWARTTSLNHSMATCSWTFRFHRPKRKRRTCGGRAVPARVSIAVRASRHPSRAACNPAIDRATRKSRHESASNDEAWARSSPAEPPPEGRRTHTNAVRTARNHADCGWRPLCRRVRRCVPQASNLKLAFSGSHSYV